MKDMKLFFLALGEADVYWDDLVRPNGRKSNSKMTKIPIWSIYIEHPEAKIIFDTGEKYQSDGIHLDDTLQRQLHLCGVRPEEIDYVVMSHLHHDHAGNIGLFPNAKIIVQRQELSDALVTAHTAKENGLYHKEDVDVIADWNLVEGRYQLLDGIEMIPLPGHTRGLQGLLLTLENMGKILITSDACYTGVNYGPPIRLSSLTVDDKLSQDTIETIKKITEEMHALVLFGHDYEQFKKLKKAPDFYN